MKPLKLELEGFTSFRERTAVDFAELDLFAITGPTGAGKSSLIDALVFALYGQVPRVGRSYRQLISHGAERMSVRLDFEVRGELYRIVRTVRVHGNVAVRLERLVGGEAEPVADRVREIEAEIERIVGLDYEAFTRSVVLPQGQFDAFLKGEPEERRKILVALLNLGVYGEMQSIVSRRAADARTRGESVTRQLQSDFAEATPEKLEDRRRECAAVVADSTRLEKKLAELTVAVADAGTVRTALAEAQRLNAGLEEERDRREYARTALASAGRRRRDLDAQLARAREELDAACFDPARQLRVAEARPEIERLISNRRHLASLQKDSERVAGCLERHAEALTAAEQAVKLSGIGELQASRALEQARIAREEFRVRHAAHALRDALEPGKPCPVCEQTVENLPAGEAPMLDPADAATATAERALGEAREARTSAERVLAKAESAREAWLRESQQIAGSLNSQRADGEALGERLRGEFGDALDVPERLVAELQEEARRLDAARRQREQRQAECDGLERDAARLEAESDAAERNVSDAGERIAQVEKQHDDAWRALEAARKTLLQSIRRAGEDDAALARLPDGRDELHVLEERRQRVEGARSDAKVQAARLEAEVARLEKDVARRIELLEQKTTLEDEATLCGTLAQHLHADQFVAYVQAEALRVLAEDASGHLLGLSQSRYSLESETQDFLVVDHWNADQRRSVKTLSGGESFLASLALALALAERLAELSVEGRAGEALDSLFLDEGFGSLDPEALDLVVQAIESLQGGERIVGVVTHIQALAERLPMRIEVRRTPSGARVALV